MRKAVIKRYKDLEPFWEYSVVVAVHYIGEERVTVEKPDGTLESHHISMIKLLPEETPLVKDARRLNLLKLRLAEAVGDLTRGDFLEAESKLHACEDIIDSFLDGKD